MRNFQENLDFFHGLKSCELDNAKVQQYEAKLIFALRYFNFEPSFKLRWCRARDLFGSQIPVTT